MLVVCILALMMLWVWVAYLPTASALTWTQDDDSEFSQGELGASTEIVGSGTGAYVALSQGVENWGALNPSPEPSVREGPCMAFDSTRDVFIMFGGYDGTYLDDTWEYDASTNTWTEFIIAGSPPTRELAAMAYDSSNDVFVLFGGYGPFALTDTWEYDPSTQIWTDTSPPLSPGQMTSYAMTYDSTAGVSILANQDFVTSTFETWSYEASLNTWMPMSPPTSPPKRTSHSLSYMPSIGRTVLFGGMDVPSTYYEDVWEYDFGTNSWAQTSPGAGPSVRFSHSAAYRNWDGSMVVYGGRDDVGGYPTETWRYEYYLGSERWQQLFIVSDPGPRHSTSLAYDPLHNKTIVFGGNSVLGYVNDTYELGAFYSPQGIFISSYIDTYYTDTIWQNIWWNLTPASQPPNTNLSFQLAVGNSSSGFGGWRGPGGSTTAYYTNPGESIWSGMVGRYLKYSARLISFDSYNTPEMDDVTIVYTIPTLPPTMIETNPYSTELGVELTRNMTVLFSEPMNTGTVLWTITNDPGSWTVEWDTADTILYLNHTTPFVEKTAYVVQITAGEDKTGVSLVPGLADNPWAFSTVAIPPTIEETEPAHNDIDVPLDHPIWINFSEPMDTATVVWQVTPDPDGWTEAWQNLDTTLYLTHSNDYNQCQPYVAEVTAGKDVKGTDLVAGPAMNPWTFETVCLDPFVQFTDPYNEQVDVPLDYSITVDFSKEVDNTTLVWTIGPDPGGWTENWGPQNRTLLLDHSSLFTDCTIYTVEIVDIQDLGGGHLVAGPITPNPWRFASTCANPFIITTSPYDGQQNVQVDEDISVGFSEGVNRNTFSWTIDPIVPGGWSENWLAGDVAVQLSHVVGFSQCTDYTVDVVYVEDPDGNPLIPGFVPNPWTFNTTCTLPVITDTYPANGTTDIPLNAPLIVNFSRDMNASTLAWGIGPDPGGWSEGWQNNNRTLTLTHSNPYVEAMTYLATISYLEDKDGNVIFPGPAPNPWQFTTASQDPFVLLTDPMHGQNDVPLDYTINITFSEPMNTGTVLWTIGPDPGGWTEQWTGGTLLTLTHSNPFTECLMYTFEVTAGQDVAGNPLTAGPVPNPFDFWTVCFSPYITNTYPVNGTIDIPLHQSLWINFSEPMNIITVNWVVVPFVGHSPTWSNGNMTLRLDHPLDYIEGTLYEVTITGEDEDANTLVPGPVPHPFYFTTVTDNPIIVDTYPADGALDVPLMSCIWINFSEPIDTATFAWGIVPDPTGWTETWDPTDMTVTLCHSTPYAEDTLYTVTVTAADDMAGNPLAGGPVSNPWSFTTEIPNPYITVTTPIDGAPGVPLDADIVIDFSEEIDTGTFAWTIVPDPGGWTPTWTLGNTRVTLNHSVLFADTTTYTVTVTAADDMDGYPLIGGPVPNPWSFTTGTGLNPFIVDTYPADGAIDVPLMSCIWINFSEPIDTTTFAWNIVPDPGGWTETWDPTDVTVTLCHSTPYAEDTLYTVTVTAADDMDGYALIGGPVQNPWSFTTEIVAPWITDTYPPNGAVEVPVDALIIVNFSEPIDVLAPFVILIVPDPGGLAPTWSNGDMTLTIDHAPFTECTLYTVTISAQDMQGQLLQAGPVPNPWSFTTVCAPYITLTDPADTQTGVPVDYAITVTFNEQIDTLTFTWGIAPDPGGWTEVWDPTDTIVTLSHANPFSQCQPYDVTVTAADDMDGNALIAGPVPNPWTFDTICPISPPTGLTVSRVFPSTVRLDWNAVVGADSYNVYDSGDKFAAFPGGWNVVSTVNNFYEFAHLDDGLTHYYIARAFNLASGESTNSTMGVKIDEAFSPVQMSIYWMSLPYNSEYATAGDIATELTETNINLVAKWDRASQQVISYYYARGKWRGRDFAIAPGDGIYVSAINTFNWYIVGTDSDTITIDLPYDATSGKHNKHYMSVPYTGAYTLASDIVVDIEGGLGPGTNVYIIEVGLWDAASQSERTYTYTPTGWAGDNFAISPGDGIYLRMASTYNWQPLLLTSEVP